MIDDRIVRLIPILGYNGTGKTTMAKRIVINELKKPDGRALIVTPDDMEWTSIPEVHYRLTHHIETYVKARRVIYYEGCLDYISEYYTDGLLAFDDCRTYLRAFTDIAIHKLMIRRRQKKLDLIFCGHGFTEVPPKIFTFASEIILFETKDNIQKRKEYIRDFDKVAEAQQRVNEKAQDNPHYYEIIKM